MRLASRGGSGDHLAACLERIERARTNRRALLMDQNPQPPDLTRALLDAASLFETLRIPYALIGGLAAMYYGRARFTEDVDFIAAADHESVLAANPDAMRRFGFDPGCTWKLYHGTGVEIDIWKDDHTDAMIARAATVSLAGHPLPIVDAHDLIAMKLRANRPQDDYDISEVLKHVAVDDGRVRDLVDREAYEHYLDIKRRTPRRE